MRQAGRAECLVQASVGSHCLECAAVGTPRRKTRARTGTPASPRLRHVRAELTNAWCPSTSSSTPRLGHGRHQRDRLHPARPHMRDLLHNDFPSDIPDGLPGQWYRLASRRVSCTTASSTSRSTCTRWGCSAQTLEADARPVAVRHGVPRACWAAAPAPCCCSRTGCTVAHPAPYSACSADHRRLPAARHQPVDDVARRRPDHHNVLLSFRGGISFGGHLGGAVADMICGFVMMAPAQRRVAGEVDVHHADPRRVRQHCCGSCHNVLSHPGLA